MDRVVSSASGNSSIASSTQHNRPTNRKRKSENPKSILAQSTAKRVKPDDQNLYKRIYSHSRKYVSPPKQVDHQDNHLIKLDDNNVYPVMNPKVVLRRLNIEIPSKYIQEEKDKVSTISMKDTAAISVENQVKIDGTTQTDEGSSIPSTEMLKVLSTIANPKVAITIGTQTDNTVDELERKQFLKFFQETQHNIKVETIEKADFNQQTECSSSIDFTCQVNLSDSNNVAEITIKNLRRNIDVSEEIIKDLRQAIGVAHQNLEEHKKTISILEARLLKANLKLMEQCGISIIEADKHNKIPVEQVLASPEDLTFVLPTSITPPLNLPNTSTDATGSIPQNNAPILTPLLSLEEPVDEILSTSGHTGSSINTVTPHKAVNQHIPLETDFTSATTPSQSPPSSGSPINLQKIVTLPTLTASTALIPHQQLPRQPRKKTTLPLASRPNTFVKLYPSQTDIENTVNSDPIRQSTALSNSAYQQQAHYFQQNLSSRQSPSNTVNPMNLVQQQQQPLQLQSQLQQNQTQSSHWHLFQSQQYQMQRSAIQQSQVQSQHMSLYQTQQSQILQSIMQRTGMRQSTQHCSPHLQLPHIQFPRTQSPQIQSPRTQSPQIQSPQIQSPQIQSPQIQSPQIQSPQIESPQIQSPQIQSPQIQSPQIQSPQMHSPPVQLSTFQPSQTQTSVLQSSQIQQTQMQASPVQSFAMHSSQMHPWQQMRYQNQMNGMPRNVRQANNFSSQFQPHFSSNQPINLSPTKRQTYKAQVPMDPRLSSQQMVNYRNHVGQNSSTANSMYQQTNPQQYQLQYKQHYQQSQHLTQQNQHQQYTTQQYMPQYTAHQSSSQQIQQQYPQNHSNRLQQRSKTTYLPNINQGQSNINQGQPSSCVNQKIQYYLQSKDAQQKQDALKRQHALQQQEVLKKLQQQDYEKQQALLRKQQNEAFQKNMALRALRMQQTLQNQETLHTQQPQLTQQQASQSLPSRLQQRSKTTLILKEQLAQNPNVLKKQQLQKQEAIKKLKELNRQEELLNQSKQQSLLNQQTVPSSVPLLMQQDLQKHQAHHKQSTPQEEQRIQQEVQQNCSSRLLQRSKTIFVANERTLPNNTLAQDLSQQKMQRNPPTQEALEKQRALKKEEAQKQTPNNRVFVKMLGSNQERVTPPLKCFYCLICRQEATIICETCHNVSSCSDHCYQKLKFNHENSTCRAPHMIQVSNILLNN